MLTKSSQNVAWGKLLSQCSQQFVGFQQKRHVCLLQKLSYSKESNA
ncbi:hypothetical protein CFP56_012255 [Quercus suber]|uniref:Uncharacterized protein n=1 Tax=Quercus suber TaxID=58331 RepID=A0AAW0M4L1_QUESU